MNNWVKITVNGRIIKDEAMFSKVWNSQLQKFESLTDIKKRVYDKSQ